MKIVAISDTHAAREADLYIPDGDILIHAGDFSGHGTMLDVAVTADWFERLPHQNILVVPGNHELQMEQNWSLTSHMMESSKVKLLWDTAVEVKGMKIYGTPWSPVFNDWAFMKLEAELVEYYERIPEGLDILITHTPPQGILDLHDGLQKGSSALTKRLSEMKEPPRLHVFGHIHEGYGVLKTKQTKYVNCSLMDGLYNLVNKPVVVHLSPRIS